MDRSIALRIAEVQEKAAEDARYLALWEEYRMRSAEMVLLLERLPQLDADVLEDYLGLTEEMHRRLLELACK